MRRSPSRRLFLGQIVASIFVPQGRAKSDPLKDGFRLLEAREAKLKSAFEKDPPAAIWGFDGIVPGPLLRFKKGEEVKIRLANKLAQPLSLNWHGIRVTNSMDGVAGLTQEPIAPGGSFDYRFVPPESGFYWYHSHVLPLLGEQLGHGLYGAMIIDEPEPPTIDQDMVVILDDWRCGAAARLDDDCSSFTINAAAGVAEKILPPASRLRLRIVNAAYSLPLAAAFFGSAPLVLAVDSQPCEAFAPAKNTIPVGPGARFDVMLDLPPEEGARAGLSLRGDKEAERTVLLFKTQGERRPPLAPIASLPQNPLLPAEIKLERARKFEIAIETASTSGAASAAAPGWKPPLNWRLNGKIFAGFAHPPLFSVKRGTPVTLGFANRAGRVLAIHLHGHAARLLHDLDDGWEPYWRDTVLIADGKTKHIAFVADNPGKWAIDCLAAEGPSAASASWFEVG
ncbi:MAG: multicopper oxidase family protein [Methylocapsa sp.]|nr:multicopper oxidase family protein [Methylocapsa sp.]